MLLCWIIFVVEDPPLAINPFSIYKSSGLLLFNDTKVVNNSFYVKYTIRKNVANNTGGQNVNSWLRKNKMSSIYRHYSICDVKRVCDKVIYIRLNFIKRVAAMFTKFNFSIWGQLSERQPSEKGAFVFHCFI